MICRYLQINYRYLESGINSKTFAMGGVGTGKINGKIWSKVLGIGNVPKQTVVSPTPQAHINSENSLLVNSSC